MKLFAPKYYNEFKCQKGECQHSCCIGWEIALDEKTRALYDSLEGEYSEKIKDSLSYDMETGVSHFKLCADERCPHLDSRGLCRIIIEYGEEALSEICREHPRFYNLTKRGLEVGLGASCEEAARLILSTEDFYSTVEVPTEDTSGACDCEVGGGFNPLSEREKVFSLLKDRTVPYAKKLDALYKEYKKSPALIPDTDWHKILSELEYLTPGDKEMFLSYTSFPKVKKENEDMLLRFLAYLIYRHASVAEDRCDFALRLGFALFCERLFASLLAKYHDTGPHLMPEPLARRVSEELEYSLDNTDSIMLEMSFL